MPQPLMLQRFDKPVGALPFIALGAGLLGLGLALAVREQGRWEQFKIEHACHVVAKSPAITSRSWATGDVTVETPEQTGWACDDGAIHWR